MSTRVGDLMPARAHDKSCVHAESSLAVEHGQLEEADSHLHHLSYVVWT